MKPPILNLADPKRLEALLEETQDELSKLQPRIDELEESISELKSLKQSKQRLLTLKMSLTAMLAPETHDNVQLSSLNNSTPISSIRGKKLFNYNDLNTLKTFSPEVAFREVDQFLKQKASLNYDIFKAVVFKGGKASTEDIKQFLIENESKQPQTGKDFTNAPLTEISSRANYLVRKGLLQPVERGVFYSPLGWVEPVNL